MQIEFHRVDWRFASSFRIAYEVRSHAETVVVELTDGPFTGRGEGLCVSYHGETVDSLLEQLSTWRRVFGNNASLEALQSQLPAGGARNALDCALWDLQAKRDGRRAWELAGLRSVNPIITAYTLGLDTPDAMAEAAVKASPYSTLKLKLAGEHDLERVAAVRQSRPDATIIVDANQSWSEQQLRSYPPKLAEYGVKLIEQPLPVGKDGLLAEIRSVVPLCADESCQTTESLSSLIGKYQFVNIKLDKAGGLTEALRLARSANNEGLQLMVGCMAGSSLSMAPAFIVGQLCSMVDLDGPLLSASDVPNGIRYEGSQMFPPDRKLWG